MLFLLYLRPNIIYYIPKSRKERIRLRQYKKLKKEWFYTMLSE